MIMLMSIALILLAGMCAGQLFRKLSLPPLIGMILAGMLVGPYVLNLLDDSILAVSSQLRRIALIIILIRAGLKLNFEDLKKVGRPAVLMCFLPACFEMAGTILLAPFLLGVSLADAAVLGAVLAAVSPAVIVPHMIHIIDEGYGVEKGIPQMILAGASVDDVFVIVVFTSAVALALGNDVSFTSLLRIPVSIFTGVAAGLLIGKLFVRLVRITKMKTAYIVILMMSVAFLMNGFEDACNDMVPFASLLAIMTMGMAVRQDDIQVMKIQPAVYKNGRLSFIRTGSRIVFKEGIIHASNRPAHPFHKIGRNLYADGACTLCCPQGTFRDRAHRSRHDRRRRGSHEGR